MEKVWLNALLTTCLVVCNTSINGADSSVHFEWLGTFFAGTVGIFIAPSLNWMAVTVLTYIEERSALAANASDKVNTVDRRLDTKAVPDSEPFSTKDAFFVVGLQAVG